MKRSHRSFLVLLAAFILTSPRAATAAITIDLDEAANFALLAIPDGSDNPLLSVSSGSGVVGNLGVGPNGHYNKSGGGSIVGNVYLDSGVTTSITGLGSPGTLFPGTNLSGPIADAVQASLDADALVADHTFGTINSSQLIVGDGDVTVVDVTTVDLSGVDALTLNAGATEFFVFNISGIFEMSGSSDIVLAGGIDPSHVLFNVTGAGSLVQFSASSVAQGTVLAPQRDITVHGSEVFGALIGNDISITSGGVVRHVPFDGNGEIPPPPPPVIPEPSTLSLLGLGGLALARRRRARG